MIGLEISLHSFHPIRGNCSHFPAIGAGCMYLSLSQLARLIRVVFKRLSKNQHVSNDSDQSQQEQIGFSAMNQPKRGKSRAYKMRLLLGLLRIG